MDPVTIAALIAAIAAVATAGVGAYTNYTSATRTNDTNAKINQQNIDYNAAMTQAAWERDDTAHQREVADLKAAGLSPLASTGGLSVSAPLGAPNPIAMQAPQVDSNSLVSSMLGSINSIENIRHNKATEANRASEIANQAKEVEIKARSLDIQDKKVEADIKYQTKIAAIEARRTDEIIRANQKGEEIKLSELDQRRLEYETKRYYEEINRQTGGRDIPSKVYSDINEYMQAREIRLAALDTLITELAENPDKVGSNSQRGGNFGLGLNIPGAPIGGNGNLGLNAQEGLYTDISESQRAKWQAFNEKYPYPVYIAK